jgi:hypothetical protein
MLKIMLGTICLMVCWISACVGQTNSTETISNWGEDVQGVQLSITMTNTIIEIGSTITLVTVIKNTSTNSIQLAQIWQPADYDVLLKSGADKVYHLIQQPLVIRMKTMLTMSPGEQNVRIIPATIGKNIEPGDYTVQATRSFSMNGTSFRLESNLLKVQVK